MPITSELFAFLADLRENNERPWFEANKKRYERHVKEPALQFVREFEPHLKAISPHFQAIAKASGGALFRIHRDTRFSADKTPYKTHTGLHFRHEAAADAHAPGFYLHLEPGASGGAVGIWQPENPVLNRIRDAIVADPAGWGEVRSTVGALGGRLALMDSESMLKRVPPGYPKDHPYADDLRRKSIGVWSRFSDEEVAAPDFVLRFAAFCREGSALASFVCRALGQPY